MWTQLVDYIYIYIYTSYGHVCDPGYHALRVHQTESGLNSILSDECVKHETQLHRHYNVIENLLGNPPKVTHEPITRIISKQLDIKQGHFTQEELSSVLRKIKNRKAAGLDEKSPEV